MRGQEKPYIEHLLFENFFMDEIKFDASKWKQYEKISYSKMQLSIAKNVYHIMNTTNALKIEEYLKKKLRFYDFGVPDFVTLYQSNNIDIATIEECVTHAIKSFEPRLSEIKIITEKTINNTVLSVTGKIKKYETDHFQIVYYNLK